MNLFLAIWVSLPILLLAASVALSVWMVRRGARPKKALTAQMLLMIIVLIACLTVTAAAAEGAAEETAAATDGMRYIGAALAVGLAGIGGGIAVAAGAPAAIGATAEDPKSFGKAIIFVAMGEGFGIYGLLISILCLVL